MERRTCQLTFGASIAWLLGNAGLINGRKTDRSERHERPHAPRRFSCVRPCTLDGGLLAAVNETSAAKVLENLVSFEKAVSSGVVLVPLTHLFVSFLFLFGYSTGFGGNVGMLFQASDVFSLSIQNLASIYITSLVVPGLAALFVLRTPNGKLPQDAEPVRRDLLGLVIAVDAVRSLVLFLLLFFLAYLMASSFYGLVNDEYFSYSIIGLLAVAIFLTVGVRILAKRGVVGAKAAILWLAANLVIAAFGSGAAVGQADRREPYAQLQRHSASCGSFLARRRAGDVFIAIGRNNERYVIDKDCKVKLRFSHRATFDTPESLSFNDWITPRQKANWATVRRWFGH
jgi:hypothetical protein